MSVETDPPRPPPLLDQPIDAPLGSVFTPYRRPEHIAPAPRWVAPVFFGLAGVMLPWTALLAVWLPEDRVTWVGFDLVLMLTLALTAWNAYRRSTWVQATASIAATLLVVDAWFDVTTSTGWQRGAAVTTALLVELPLAGLSLWIARHAAAVLERSTQYLYERTQRQAARLGDLPDR